ncbi:MAG: hypothetical protein QXE04_03790, partial [Thermoplasmatales archaeon]
MPFEKLAKMILPREVIGGHGAIQEVADVFKKITSSNRGIIVTGSKTLKLAGEKVGKILEESGINTDFVIVG